MYKLIFLSALSSLSLFANPLLAQTVEINPSLDTSRAEIATPSSKDLLPAETDKENKINFTISQQDIELGRLTPKPTFGYIGAGINIGINDDDAQTIGDTGVLVTSKFPLSSTFSLRPSVVIANEIGFIIPITYEFTLPTEDPETIAPISPYAGGGVAITTGDYNSIGAVLTGGIDYRFNKDFVANAAVNLGLMEDSTEFGVHFSVGYILQKRQ